MRSDKPLIVPATVNQYLRCSDIVDFDDTAVSGLADSVAGGDDVTVLIVRDRFTHSFDAGAESGIACSASDVVRLDHGLCYAKSHLLAALLRSNGISGRVLLPAHEERTGWLRPARLQRRPHRRSLGPHRRPGQQRPVPRRVRPRRGTCWPTRWTRRRENASIPWSFRSRTPASSGRCATAQHAARGTSRCRATSPAPFSSSIKIRRLRSSRSLRLRRGRKGSPGGRAKNNGV
jgi:hypothetical protein